MNNFMFDARALAIGLACLILAPTVNHAEDKAISPLGDFTAQTDVGEPALKGAAAHRNQTP